MKWLEWDHYLLSLFMEVDWNLGISNPQSSILDPIPSDWTERLAAAHWIVLDRELELEGLSKWSDEIGRQRNALLLHKRYSKQQQDVLWCVVFYVESSHFLFTCCLASSDGALLDATDNKKPTLILMQNLI